MFQARNLATTRPATTLLYYAGAEGNYGCPCPWPVVRYQHKYPQWFGAMKVFGDH